jgi:SAM-dependent methyltransferase
MERTPAAHPERRLDEEAAAAPCLVCARQEVDAFLDLGETALANKFLTEAELSRPEPKFPLVVGFCRGCGHVQLTEHVPPSALFEDYLYIPSASTTLTAHLYELSDVVAERYSLGPGDLVIDVGCNDATLLRGFRRHGVRALGVDPAKNLAELFDNPEIERYTAFFDSRLASEIRDRFGEAAVVTATNTFPHIPGLWDFMLGLDTVLAPGGVFVIEVHYLVDLLEQCAFDTIYHEHVSYWGLGPMTRLFEEHEMRVVRVERLRGVHHGQLRVFVQREGEGRRGQSVVRMLAAERQRGIDRFETYEEFARRVYTIRNELSRTLSELRAAGNRIAAYGAPAKGNTLLGFLELGPDRIEYIVDRNRLKQGLYTPQSHIPVVSPERLLEDQPEYALLLAWNFADEVLAQQAEYRARGGRFIIPVPEVRVV